MKAQRPATRRGARAPVLLTLVHPRFRFDGLLKFGHPLVGVGLVLQGDLANVAGGAVPAGVDPPGQGLGGGQDVVPGAGVDDGGRAVHLGQIYHAEAILSAGLGDDRHGGVHDDGAVARRYRDAGCTLITTAVDATAITRDTAAQFSLAQA